MLKVPVHIVQYFTEGILIDLGSSVTKGILYSRSKRPYENLSWNELSRRERRARILEEQDGKCLGCRGYNWRGAKLTFQLDHIDGDNKNDVRENLRFLCPNCHSQTPTWGMNGRTHTAESIAKFIRKKEIIAGGRGQ